MCRYFDNKGRRKMPGQLFFLFWGGDDALHGFFFFVIGDKWQWQEVGGEMCLESEPQVHFKITFWYVLLSITW